MSDHDLTPIELLTRATSLLAGPGRTEFFTYFGARARFFEHLEPALWIAFPLGSVRNANTFQIGAEIRFSYDLYDVLNPSGGDRRDAPLLNSWGPGPAEPSHPSSPGFARLRAPLANEADR